MATLKYTLDQLNQFDLDKVKEIKKELKIKSNLRSKDKIINLVLEELQEPGKHSNKQSVRKSNNKQKDKYYNTCLNKSFLKKLTNIKRPITDNQTDKDDNTKVIRKDTLKFIERLHNILYTYESIVDKDAMNDIIMLFMLKFINEKQEIFDIYNKDNYPETKYTLFTKIQENDKLKNFLSFNIDNEIFKRSLRKKETYAKDNQAAPKDLITQIGELFVNHKILKTIFKVDNFLNAKQYETIHKLMNEFKSTTLQFKEVEDLMGEIYEYFLNKYGKGKSKLGQFFTPRTLMKCILDVHHDKFKNITKDISIYDPCMGTAGFLVFMNNFIKKNNPNVNINLYGNEIEPTTFKYSNINIMNSIDNYKPDYLYNEDSIIYIRNFKVDYIFTNPPFGSNSKDSEPGSKKTYLESSFNKNRLDGFNNMGFNNIYKLDDKNMPIQVLEACIWKLNDGGFCNIVLPYGELFFSDRYSNARTHFMNLIDIDSIILIPGGVFTHTGIKTCVVSFTKSSEGTKQIKFMEVNTACDEITELITITKDDIMNQPTQSWYLQDYVEDDYIERLKTNIQCDWIEFGKLFTLEKGQIASEYVSKNLVDENSNVKFITKGPQHTWNNIKENSNTINNGEVVVIATSSNGNDTIPIHYYNGKYEYSNLVSKLNTNTEYKTKINLKYIYYYLLDMKAHIEDYYQKGSCNKSLDIKNFNRMLVPIPTIDTQNKVAEYFDNKYQFIEKNNYLTNEIKHQVKAEWDIQFTFLKMNNYKNCKWIEFGNLFTLEKGQIQSSKVEEDENGDIMFINQSKKKDGYKINKLNINNKYIYNDELLGISNANPVGFVKYYNKSEYILTDLLLKLNTNTEYKTKINLKYIYYYLLDMKAHIEDYYQKGSCNKSLDIKNFNRMNILIPNMNIQNNIVETLDNLQDLKNMYNSLINITNEKIKNKFIEVLKFNLDTTN
jgi:type I restriction-modification system DNA methylase subunit